MMKVSLVCFTRMGFETMKKIAGTGSAGGNEEKWDTSLWVAGRYALRLAREDAGLPYQAITEGGLSAWTGAEFQRSDALIFVGACGIAVRAIAPFVQDKFHDPAVLCVDEAGTFVIPLLSGHVGGANRLAEFVAGGIGAVPVVTTATDVERKFAVDVFAKDHGLVITDRVLAKRNRLACSRISAFQDGKKYRKDCFATGSVNGISGSRCRTGRRTGSRQTVSCASYRGVWHWGSDANGELPRRRSERRWRTL